MTPKSTQWDAFISHASEDKDVARALAEQLRAFGLRVWFDEFTLHVGDSLRRSIDYGLANSRFGIVILSHSFFLKEWPQRELDGLVALATTSRKKKILSVWHKINHKDVAKHSPTLADLVAVSTGEGIDKIAIKLAEVIKPQFPDGPALSKTDLVIAVASWYSIEEEQPAEWHDFERKSKMIKRTLEKRLIERGYNPTYYGESTGDITVVEYRDLPLRYFIELKEIIDPILRYHIDTIIWLENKYMGWNLIVKLGKEVGK